MTIKSNKHIKSAAGLQSAAGCMDACRTTCSGPPRSVGPWRGVCGLTGGVRCRLTSLPWRLSVASCAQICRPWLPTWPTGGTGHLWGGALCVRQVAEEAPPSLSVDRAELGAVLAGWTAQCKGLVIFPETACCSCPSGCSHLHDGNGCDSMGCCTLCALPPQAGLAPVSWALSFWMLLCSPSALEEILAAAANGASAKGKRKKKGAARLGGKENSQEGAPCPVRPSCAPLCTPDDASRLPTNHQIMRWTVPLARHPA